MPRSRKSVFEKDYVYIVDRLIARRHELGMSQTELAVAYGEDQPFISRVERRQRRIDVYEFVLFCRALRIMPAEILDQLVRDASA